MHDATLRACDALDGLADGVVSNQPACRAAFSPRSLLCGSAEAAGSGTVARREPASAPAVRVAVSVRMLDTSRPSIDTFRIAPMTVGTAASTLFATAAASPPRRSPATSSA